MMVTCYCDTLLQSPVHTHISNNLHSKAEEMLVFYKGKNLHDFPTTVCTELSYKYCATMHALLWWGKVVVEQCTTGLLSRSSSFPTNKKPVRCRTDLYCSISTLRENFQIRHQTLESNINPLIRNPQNLAAMHWISTDKNFLSEFSILSSAAVVSYFLLIVYVDSI